MSDRAMTPAAEAEIAKSRIRICRLVKLLFDGGAQYHTDGPRDVQWGGNTYITGHLLNVGQVNETVTLRTEKLSIVLSGVQQANISTALTEQSIDREVFVYRAFFDNTEQLIIDPVEEWRGRIDDWRVREDPGTGGSTLSWRAASHWVDWKKVNGRRATHEDQQLHFSGDMFFEVPALDLSEIPWGRG